MEKGKERPTDELSETADSIQGKLEELLLEGLRKGLGE